MELDPITKWLVRISSSMIILLGIILVIAIPLVALKTSSIISSTQETFQNILQDILTSLLAKLWNQSKYLKCNINIKNLQYKINVIKIFSDFMGWLKKMHPINIISLCAKSQFNKKNLNLLNLKIKAK